MTRGTTPSYVITIKDDVDLSEVTDLYVTLKQSETSKVTRKNAELEGKAITLTLTQEETLLFKEGEAELQVRGKFSDGVAFATKVIRVPVNRVLYDEVI